MACCLDQLPGTRQLLQWGLQWGHYDTLVGPVHTQTSVAVFFAKHPAPFPPVVFVAKSTVRPQGLSPCDGNARPFATARISASAVVTNARATMDASDQFKRAVDASIESSATAAARLYPREAISVEVSRPFCDAFG